MRKLLAKVWVGCGIAAVVLIGIGLLANIGPIIVFFIVLALIPVVVELLLAALGVIGLVAAWVFVTVWEWLSPTESR